MQPSDPSARPHELSSPTLSALEGLGVAPPLPAPVPQQSVSVPTWLHKIMLDRQEQRRRTEEARGHAGAAWPAHASGDGPGQLDKSGDLPDPLKHADDSLDDDRTPQEGTNVDAEVMSGEDVPPLPLPAGLDVVPPASRHSYGDFSSASSTTSSSASTSGFSSHSASSATTVSSTTTFSAAGWNGAQGCPGLPLKGLATLSSPEVCDEGGEDADTPSAESCETTYALSAPVSPAHGASADDTVTFSALSSSAPSHAAGAADHLRASLLPRPASPSTASVSSSTAVLPDFPAPADDSILTPPENFAMVSPGLYRSSFPRRANFAFLRSLGLKSVMVLVQEPYPEENLEFLRQEGIQFFQYGIPGNKEPFVSVPEDKVVAAMAAALDTRNLPMLIHCNKGKHRTGCVIGCLRRLQKWSLTAVFEEYRRYSFPKSRALDLQCIEAFGGLGEVMRVVDRNYLPSWADPDPPPPFPLPSS